MADTNTDVNTPTAVYQELNVKWAMIQALAGGTTTMRAAGKTYLPKETKETQANYDKRLSRSFLFAGYRDSVEKIIAKPFSRDVLVSAADALPDQLKVIEGDADRSGTDLTTLSRELMEIAINHGLVHVWVNYPRVEDGVNLREQRERGIRPFFIPVSPTDLVGWQTDDGVLTQARIREWTQVPNGAYGSVSVLRVRVLTVTGWELWEQQENDEFAQIEEGEWQGFSGVPLVTAYLSRTDLMSAVPVLEDLAWMNIAHWQSSSDQRNILRFARTGLLFIKGISPEEIKEQGGIVIGPNSTLTTTNPNADAKIVEHSGGSIESGEKDLASLEQKMQVLGLQPFFRLSGAATATEKKIDENRTETEIQAWIKSIETLLRRAYEMAARWVEDSLPEDFGIGIYNDFVLSGMIDSDLQTLIKMRMNGDIDRETLIHEVKRRGLFGGDVTEEEILDRVEREGPDLAGITDGEDA